jgi:nucleoside-diphosphate-sugar epimerase
MPMLLAGPLAREVLPENVRGRGARKTICIIGDGGNRHQVVARSDVAQAYILRRKRRAAGEGSTRLRPGQVPTVRQMAEGVIERIGSKSKITRIRLAWRRCGLCLQLAG